MVLSEERVNSLETAFLYSTECNLATISHLAMLRNKSKHEYKRQISIAQKMIDCIQTFKISVDQWEGQRFFEIIKNNLSVENWAKQYEVC